MWIKESWRSFRKSLKIIKISKKVTLKKMNGNTYSALVEYQNKRNEGLIELWELLDRDPYLSVILKHHDVDRERLEKIYTQIEISGAGQWVRGHFIPVSAFAFVYPLDYIIRTTSKDEFSHQDNLVMGFTLIRYFENGNIGPFD